MFESSLRRLDADAPEGAAAGRRQAAASFFMATNKSLLNPFGNMHGLSREY